MRRNAQCVRNVQSYSAQQASYGAEKSSSGVCRASAAQQASDAESFPEASPRYRSLQRIMEEGRAATLKRSTSSHESRSSTFLTVRVTASTETRATHHCVMKRKPRRNLPFCAFGRMFTQLFSLFRVLCTCIYHGRSRTQSSVLTPFQLES